VLWNEVLVGVCGARREGQGTGGGGSKIFVKSITSLFVFCTKYKQGNV